MQTKEKNINSYADTETSIMNIYDRFHRATMQVDELHIWQQLVSSQQ